MTLRTRLVILDGQPLAYRNYYSRGTRDLCTSAGMKSGAYFGFLRSFLSLKKQFVSSAIMAVFDGGDSGRRTFFPGYKDRPREGMRAFARQVGDVQETLGCLGVPVLHCDGIEADDFISVATHRWIERHVKNSVIIVSSDRDFFQLVSDRVALYDDKANTFFGRRHIREQFGLEPEHFLWYRCLVGDPADMIPRVPGFTAKKAQAAAPLGMLAVNGPDIEVFMRNQRLMQLPTTFVELHERFASVPAKRLDRLVAEAVNAAKAGGFAPDHAAAQVLLDKYECRSLNVADFASY